MKSNITHSIHELELGLCESIKVREKTLSRLPEGRLHCNKNRNYYTWYMQQMNDGKRTNTPIHKSDRRLAEQLALRAYHETALATERKQLRAAQLFLKNYVDATPGASYIAACPEHIRLLESSIALSGYSKAELKWMYEEPPCPVPFPEERNVPSMAEYDVRSKSESEYVTAMMTRHLLFRYEWPLELHNSGIIVWPDFTVIHPRSKRTIYIEHFGRMDDPEYVMKNAKKLNDYMLNGIYPGRNLFISYESNREKFTSLDADAMINQIFFAI